MLWAAVYSRAVFVPVRNILFHGKLGRPAFLHMKSFGVKSMFLLRASDGGNQDGSGSRTAQGGGAGTGGGAGGEDVVDEQDRAAAEGFGTRNKKSAAHIGATLMRAEARLTFGGAPPCEQPRGQLHAQLRASQAQSGEGGAREQLRLIEAALTVLAFEKRHGDDEEIGRQIGEGEDRFGEKSAEAPGKRLHTVVLEQVEEGTELIVIHAVRDGLAEIGRGDAAGTAKGVIGGSWIEFQGFAAVSA